MNRNIEWFKKYDDQLKKKITALTGIFNKVKSKAIVFLNWIKTKMDNVQIFYKNFQTKIKQYYDIVKAKIAGVSDWYVAHISSNRSLMSKFKLVLVIQTKLAITLILIMGIITTIFLLKMSLILIFFIVGNALFFIYDLITK